MKPRTCVECGAAFLPRNNAQICCGDECSTVHQKRRKAEAYAIQKEERRAARLSPARRRAEFLAARDAAYVRAGLPPTKVEVRDGIRIERRGHGFGSIH